MVEWAALEMRWGSNLLESSNLSPSAFASLKLGFGGYSPQEGERRRENNLCFARVLRIFDEGLRY